MVTRQIGGLGQDHGGLFLHHSKQLIIKQPTYIYRPLT